GIIGEDGLTGIQLGKTYPGSCFYEFQQEVLNLYNRGVIVALCSKNNENDVWEVFQNHPDMVLNEEHIATFRINWEDKATNLQKIARDLNISLDSIVFLDDSEFEVNLVRNALPDVEVVHMPKNNTVFYRDILASCGWFDTLTLSEEDKKRGALYKAEINRKQLQTQMIDMDMYFKSLVMKLYIHFADDFAIPRISQLTQKTNQFNLTTRRYSEADIKKLSENTLSDVIYVRLTDKFGDNGIVGVCILKYMEKKALIDTFLLSCRVLGRGVEDAFLSNVIKLSQIRGAERLIGEYYATQKNGQVEHFYSKRGFRISEKIKQQSDAVYYYDLVNGIAKEPDFFVEIDSEIDKH
ncbi:MAG: HAD-IIIC family phosphatase, partial [Candidatus Hodarchaeota archaeon]